MSLSNTSNDLLTKCPQCSSFVKNKNLSKHLRRVHPIGNPATTQVRVASKSPTINQKKVITKPSTPATKRSKVQPNSSLRSMAPTKAQEQRIQSNRAQRALDGSRDFRQYRETGRFGSHPSYDDYGDESFA